MKDVENMAIKKWRKHIQDRTNWKQIVEKTKTNTNL